MARQGNILDFNEVKKSVDKPRASSAASKNSAKKPSKRSPAKKSVSTGNKKASTSSKVATAKKSSPKPSVKPASKVSSRASEKPTTRKSTAKRPERVKVKASLSEPLKPTNEKQNKGSSEKVSKFSEAKKERSKNKASKEYSKQFGKEKSTPSSAGPRAAVYKGEMGRQHKKSSKMQGGPSPVVAVRKKPFGGFDWKNSPRFIASVMIIGCLALSGAFLYPAAQQYYLTVREHDRIEAEYQLVQERNDDIRSQVELLSSEEGIEDRARQEFGWVKEGENSVKVHGLETEEESVTYSKNISAGSVEAPPTWYSPMLDVIFGVE